MRAHTWALVLERGLGAAQVQLQLLHQLHRVIWGQGGG